MPGTTKLSPLYLIEIDIYYLFSRLNVFSSERRKVKFRAPACSVHSVSILIGVFSALLVALFGSNSYASKITYSQSRGSSNTFENYELSS